MSVRLSQAQFDKWLAHTVERVAAAPVSPEPFGHCRMENVLPSDLFANLRGMDLRAVTMLQRPPGVAQAEREKNRFYLTVNRRSPKSMYDDAPFLVLAFMLLSHPTTVAALRQLLSDQLAAEFGRSDLVFDPSLTLVEDRSGYELLPHTDIPSKAITLLIYLAGDGDDPRLGTELFWLRDEHWLLKPDIMHLRLGRHLFSRVETVPYLPNHGLAFVPSQSTFHGVAEVKGSVRRILQYQLSVSADVAQTRRQRQAGDATASG